MVQKDKKKFRDSSIWKHFRKKMKERDKVDQITNKPLLKGFQLHHLNLDEKQYKNIDVEDNFVCLNRMTHSMVHFLYRYYQKDPSIIDRLKSILDKMREINNDV